MKLVITIRMISGNTKIDESNSVYDVSGVTEDDTKNLVARLRLLTRRELIRRGIITPEPEDTARQR
jgi:hypothetical protein